MAVALANGRFNYTLKADRKSKHPTVFIIRELTAIERGTVIDAFSDVSRLAALGNKKRLTASDEKELRALVQSVRAGWVDICAGGISDVTGVLDASGHEVAMSVKDVVHLMRDPADIEELASAVLSHNVLGDDEKKSFETPPLSPNQAAVV